MNKVRIICIALFAVVVTSEDSSTAKQSTTTQEKCSYSKCLADKVDTQIEMELEAFYFYLRIGNFFAHENQSLPGLSKFFLENSQEELKHAQMMIDFQIKRGHSVDFTNIKGNELNRSWVDATEALLDALHLEKTITSAIEELHASAVVKKDIPLQDFLETNFIPEQYDSMKVLSDYVKTLQRLTSQAGNSDLAIFQFDKLVLQKL